MTKGQYIGYYANRQDPNRVGSPGGKYRKWARKMRRRYGYCMHCGKDDRKLEIHHNDPSMHNVITDDVLVLCQSCHRRLHARIRTGASLP